MVTLRESLGELESGDYKPGWAVFNRFRTKRAVAKAELIQARNLLADQLLVLRSKENQAVQLETERIAYLTEQDLALHRREHIIEAFELQSKVDTALQMLEIAIAESNRRVIEEAAEHGMLPQNYQQILVFESSERIRVGSELELERGKAEIQILMESEHAKTQLGLLHGESNIRIREEDAALRRRLIEEDRAMERRTIEAGIGTKIEIQRHREFGEIDIENRWKEIVQDLDAADLIELSDVQLMGKLTNYLIEMRRERFQLSQGSDADEVKGFLLARYDKNIANLEARIDARQERLLLSENGKETLRLTEGTTDRRAISSEAIEATEE